MAITTPEIEPASFRAGDTVSWLRDLSDYLPADGWTLKYAFRKSSSKINITTTTSGTKHLATITAATSATFTAGRYDWIAYVIKGTSPNQEQHTVDEGACDVLPNLSLDANYDARSDARIIYDDLIAAYKAFISANGMMQAFTVAGKSVSFRSSKEILDQIKYWATQVRAEEAAEAVANGNKDPRQVGVRLTRI
jgi:hypothetical protein